MKRVTSTVILTGVGIGAGGVIVRRALRSSSACAHKQAQERWWAVTINRPSEEVAPQGRWPGSIAQLGDTVEVAIRPAPGGKGTELAARLRQPGALGVAESSQSRGETSRQAVRSALSQAKQLIEVGEVLRATRHHTANAGVRLADCCSRRRLSAPVRKESCESTVLDRGQ